jgi:ATP-dependent Lon protease
MNRPDLLELPAEVREDITFVPVSTLEEVLRVAIPAGTHA